MHTGCWSIQATVNILHIMAPVRLHQLCPITINIYRHLAEGWCAIKKGRNQNFRFSFSLSSPSFSFAFLNQQNCFIIKGTRKLKLLWVWDGFSGAVFGGFLVCLPNRINCICWVCILQYSGVWTARTKDGWWKLSWRQNADYLKRVGGRILAVPALESWRPPNTSLRP